MANGRLAVKDADRNARILSMRGEKSFGLIAKELGLTRNIVAGVCWRASWPKELRIPSENSRTANKCGLGYHAGGIAARQTLPRGGASHAGNGT